MTLALTVLLAAQSVAIVAAPLARLAEETPTRVSEISSNGQAYIYVFGDSYSTIGYDPTGLLQPTVSAPLGIPNALGVTTSGTGHTNWVQKVTVDHKPSSLTTFTYDYAVAGAFVNSTRYPKVTHYTDFLEQIQSFFWAGTRPAFNSTQSVAIAYWGTNDIVAHSLSTAGDEQDNTVITATMDDYWTQMEYLHFAGVRNYVVLQADPVERAPSAVAPGVPLSFAKLLLTNRAEWNRQLLERVATFRAIHPDSNVATINTDPIFNDILDYPQEYGSPNNTCHNADGTSCLWWDTLHPGQAIHTSLANSVAATLVDMGFYPPT